MRCKNSVNCSYGDICNTYHFVQLSYESAFNPSLRRWIIKQIRPVATVHTVDICEEHHNELLLLVLYYGTALKVPYEFYASGDIEEVQEWRRSQVE